MFVWKCVHHDRTALLSFKYPEAGQIVRHPRETTGWYSDECLHGWVAGGNTVKGIIYRPNGLWLLLETLDFIYGWMGQEHVMFKEAMVVAEFSRFKDLLAHPEMKGQGGFEQVGEQYNLENVCFSEDGVCKAYGDISYGLLGAETDRNIVAAGPNGWIKLHGIKGHIGVDTDISGRKLMPYTWYKRVDTNWVRD